MTMQLKVGVFLPTFLLFENRWGEEEEEARAIATACDQPGLCVSTANLQPKCLLFGAAATEPQDVKSRLKYLSREKAIRA